jgi:UDPglucose 6-dehydrogenase
MKVGFIGVGKLGKEVGEVMAEKYDVIGYDIDTVTPENFKMVFTLKSLCKDRDIIFVAVPTPHHPNYDGRYPTSHLKPKDFDYSIVKSVLIELNKYTNKNQLVVLISTVLPGTIRREFIPLVKNYRFIYNPYLIAMGTVKWDMVNPEMVIIGTEDGSETGDAAILREFYKTIINPQTRYEIGTWDDAEAIKIFYNTFISTKVGLVNMIQDIAEKNGNINTDTVTGAIERSTQRIISPSYMKAGMGDGGSCHPRDNIALRWLANELGIGYDIFSSIMLAREKQAENIAKKLVSLSKKYNLPVVILGKAYKPNVIYEDGSTSVLTGYYIEKMGVELQYDTTNKPAVYLLAHRGVFNEIQLPNGSVVLDVWREYKNDELKVYYYGNILNKKI